MAKKITDLPTANTFTGVESVLLTQDNKTVQGSVSAILDHGLSYIAATSGDWDSSYTTVGTNSASWDAHTDPYDDSLLQSTSGDWDSSYTTVEVNSASWNIRTDPYDDTLLQSSSSNWDNTYNTVESNSASWDAHTDPYDDTLLQSSSSNWDSSYTTVEANSASWASHTDVTELQAASAEWDDTSTAVQTNSSAWAIDTIYDDTDVAAYLNGNLNTHIIPLSNQTYDLGDAEHKFRHLYLSTSTIYMGESSTPITLEDGKLSVGGNIVAQSPLPQAITPLSAYEAPAPYIIDLAQCMNAEIILTSNMSLQLTGAEKGQSGMLALGNGNAHDGVGFTVDFYPDNIVSQTHAEGGHSVMAGDLADFAIAPAAGEYNYGTIGWYYTGTEYLLYVSEVKPFTTAIQPNVDGGVLVSGVTDVPAVNGSYYKGSGTVDGYDWWYLPGTNFVIWNDGFFANISDAGDGTDTNPGSFTINTYWWAGDGTNSSYPAFTYSGAQGSSDTATVTLIA